MTKAKDIIDEAARAGPMWQGITIVEALCQLANKHKQDITMERATGDGALYVKVKGR